MTAAQRSTVDEIVTLFETRGEAEYFGEPVSQREHALQAAHLAEQEGASDALIVAALLHDVGHLLHHEGEDIADKGIDARHEAVGDAWLTHYFGPEVTEPARLHVAAKRYLCTVEPEYLRQLSPASQQSLKLQNGLFSPQEVQEFEQNPHFRDAGAPASLGRCRQNTRLERSRRGTLPRPPRKITCLRLSSLLPRCVVRRRAGGVRRSPVSGACRRANRPRHAPVPA